LAGHVAQNGRSRMHTESWWRNCMESYHMMTEETWQITENVLSYNGR